MKIFKKESFVKKFLLLSLLAAILCAFLISCNSTVSDNHTMSEEASEQDLSESSGVESVELSDSTLSSEDDEKPVFTKEDALAYFKPERAREFASANNYLDFAYEYEGSALNLPFSEFVKWIEGTSEIIFTDFGYSSDNPIGIYDYYFTSRIYKPFTETTFYGVRINGKKMNFHDGAIYNYGWVPEEVGKLQYSVDYAYRESEQERAYDDVTCSVTRLFESNTNYEAMLDGVSKYYQTVGKIFSDTEVKTIKIFDQTTDKYYDVEALCGKAFVGFVFGEQVFCIEFNPFKDDYEIADDVLNNIVIMDLLEEYNKIK